MSLSVSFNDYGFHLCSNENLELGEKEWRELLTPENLIDELLDCMNLSEMAKRQFREVARVAGLIFQGYPGAQKSARQVQASGGLFFDVFSKYDPENLLLTQSRREVLERQLEVERILSKLEEIKSQNLIIKKPIRLSPFAFPLWAESLRTQVSTESWGDRVRKMAQELEQKTDSMSPTNSQIDIVWQGEKLHLLARKGIFWPKEKTLFVADPHFGKAATFRKVGIPVSEHTTEDDCNRLLQMIESTEANKLVFLGDFLHARQGKTGPVRTLLFQWRDVCRCRNFAYSRQS